jgi:two-component system, sensor histidine kinase and response regulator
MKTFFVNIFKKIENEKSRKTFLIFTFGTIGMLTTLFFTIDGFNEKRSTFYIISLFSLCSFTTANLVYFFIRRNIVASAHILIFSFFIFCTILFAFIGVDYSGVLWYFVFSPLAILLTDFKKGLIYNILLFLITIFFVINPMDFVVNIYPPDFLLRFILAFPIVNIFILIFEYTRSRAFSAYVKTLNDVNEKNIELLVAKKELKKHNEQLKEREKQLRELNATKDKLFSIIAHDLRSPFSSILGFSEPLDENEKNKNCNESEQSLATINSTAKSTLTLLDNLLNWAKSQIGQIRFETEKLNLSITIQEIIEILDSNAKIKNISLNHSQSGNFEILADPNMLKTVLRNLICNAIKYSNINGEIDISAISEQNQITISVSDNGVGMNKEAIDNLFKIDTIVTTKGTAKESGSGLGLIICKEFVEIHSGKIWVESEIGKGSKFIFTIPQTFKK